MPIQSQCWVFIHLHEVPNLHAATIVPDIAFTSPEMSTFIYFRRLLYIVLGSILTPRRIDLGCTRLRQATYYVFTLRVYFQTCGRLKQPDLLRVS